MLTFQELTKNILFDQENYKTLYDSVHAMHDLYASHTGISARDVVDEGIALPTGLAISPISAAHCLKDVRRTAVFLRGIYKGILQLRETFPGQRINILYAGCGPYATLVTPLTTLFTDKQLSVLLLDVNQSCLDSVKGLYESLGISGYIGKLICADASVYKLPDDEVVHMIISETMQAALATEPQVAVMLNLIPQMAEHTLFIPEEIAVDLKLVSWEEEQKRLYSTGYEPERIDLSQLYKISRTKTEMPNDKTIAIPTECGKFSALTLFTNITVFKDEALRPYQSGLSLPKTIDNLKIRQGKNVHFRYDMSDAPRFYHRWTE